MRWTSCAVLLLGLAGLATSCQGAPPPEPPPSPEPPAPGQLDAALPQLVTLERELCAPLLNPTHPAFFIKALYGDVPTPFVVGERDEAGRWGRFTPVNAAGAAELLALSPAVLEALIAPVNALGARRVERWGAPGAERVALRFADGWLVCGGPSSPGGSPAETCASLSETSWRCPAEAAPASR